MLNSLLMVLEGVEQATPVIRCGVELARRANARVRGLTLVDTRDSQLAGYCESAVFLTMAGTRQALADCLYEGTRVELSHACLAAKLDFDVRRLTGNPLEVLPREARFHDLVVSSIGEADERFPPDASTALSIGDWTALLQRGLQPLLLLPPKQESIDRVLMIYDGSDTAGRTIRSYLSLGVLHEAEHRLLAIGPDQATAQASLKEMDDYCAKFCNGLEAGFAVGSSRRVLVNFAAKWEADLLVLGLNRRQELLHRLLGRISLDLMHHVGCGLFVQM